MASFGLRYFAQVRSKYKGVFWCVEIAVRSAANPRPASPCVSFPASVKFTCALIPHYSALRGLLTAQVDTIWFHLRHQSAFYVHTGHIPRAGDFHDKDIFLNLKYFY